MGSRKGLEVRFEADIGPSLRFGTEQNGRHSGSMIPEVGQRFGPYEILGRLGSGAMGLVFRAWDARLHREVAVKLLHDDYDMPGMRERFLQEARAASALNHPHICTIFDLGEQDGEPYMVMELLEGETLKEKISRGAVPVDEIISYAQEVADALAAAHAKGIVHRDVKPANIFLVNHPNGRKQAKVLDFGLAKIGLAMRGGRTSRALDLTLAGATVGTLSYMSPEQARGQTLDERSDLFSLGVVMYEMATRQVPFQGATSALIFVQLLNHIPEALHEWNDTIPKELERIVLKLLSKERDARYQTANDLAAALRKIPFRSSGGWLKRAAPTVPLVKAADPVARIKRPMRPPTVPDRLGKSVILPPETPAPVLKPVRTASSGDNTLIRPVARTPYRSDGSRDRGVLRGDRALSNMPARLVEQTSVAVSDSGDKIEAVVEPIVAAVPPVETVVNKAVPAALPRVEAKLQSKAASNQSKTVQSKLVEPVNRRAEKTVIPARSRSGVTQFEFGEELERLAAVGHAPAAVPLTNVVRRGNVAVKTPAADAEAEKKRARIRLVVAAGVVVIALLGGLLALNHGRLQPVVLQPGDPLLLTLIQNRTGDKALDGVAVQGLELVLEQSPYLTVRGGEAYRAGLRQVELDGTSNGPASSRRVAQAVGAKAYLYGELTGSENAYLIHVDVLKTDSNDKLTSIEEKAEGKEQIAAAIDRIASRVRSDMGESDRAIAKSSNPLEKEASSDVVALHAYAVGEAALQSGRTGDAIAAYVQAKVADPKFTQTHLRLAWLYRSEFAEGSAAAEAKLAQEAAESTSDRLKLLTQFCYEMNATGDFGRATGVMKQFKELFPQDDAVLLGQARVLRAQGHMPEALQAAQQAYGVDPYNVDAYAEAEVAMVGMDRARGALQLQEQAQRLGVMRGGDTIAAAYLAGDKDALAKLEAVLRSANDTDASFGRVAAYGLYLDNDGQIASATALWRTAAANAANADALRSGLIAAQPYLLAQAGLDRALTRSCSEALSFVKEAENENMPMGLVASFNSGMTEALCGDAAGAEQAIAGLKQSFPNSTAVDGYYVADLQAAIALEANDPKGALAALGSAAPYDQISLTPYLRGLAHLGTGEGALAVADFQTIIDHRGATFIAGSNMYPMAQIGLARAYAATGDKVNSVAAYKRFLELWQDADRGQPLLVEAAAKSR